MRRNTESNNPEQLTVTDKAAIQALVRYEKDLIALQKRRESEKNTFFDNIALANEQKQEAQRQTAQMHQRNQEYICLQKEWHR